jgi:hypothetical protein
VWYINWDFKKEAIAEQFVKNMISAMDEILAQKELQEKVNQFVEVGFPTPFVVGISENDVDYYNWIDNYAFANEEISDLDFFAELLESEIERKSWSGVSDGNGIKRYNGTIKCGYQLYHDGKFVSHNKMHFFRSHGIRGNKPKTHK